MGSTDRPDGGRDAQMVGAVGRRPARTAAECAAAIAFAAVFVVFGFRLAEAFPTSYTWSELMIDYQGGFIRRGLLGEIAFRLDGVIPAPDFLTAAVVTTYCGCAVWLVALTRRTDSLVAATFLLSPAGLLFPVYDDVVFGRKDVFVVAAFLIAAALVARAPKRPALAGLPAFAGLPALAGLLATYIVAGLVVETAWLYLPVAVALYAAARGRGARLRWHLAVWTAAGLVLGLCLLATYLMNRGLHDPVVAAGHESAMVRAWQAIYPDAYTQPGALQWLGMSPVEGVQMALRQQGHRNTFIGYALAFVLAQLPLALFTLRSRSCPAGLRERLPALAAFAVMTATFLAGADWGRYIHLWTLHAFVFAVLTRRPVARAPGADRSAVLVAVALVALYGATWRLRHYVLAGDSALVPGEVFRLVRTTP